MLGHEKGTVSYIQTIRLDPITFRVDRLIFYERSDFVSGSIGITVTLVNSCYEYLYTENRRRVASFSVKRNTPWKKSKRVTFTYSGNRLGLVNAVEYIGFGNFAVSAGRQVRAISTTKENGDGRAWVNGRVEEQYGWKGAPAKGE